MKKPIKIENVELIEKAINEAQGKARTRLMDISYITWAIEQVEKRLKLLGIPKKHWKGIWFTITPEKLPNSYKDRAEGTYAQVIYSNGWKLKEVSRVYCQKCKFGGSRDINLYAEVARAHIQTNITL